MTDELNTAGQPRKHSVSDDYRLNPQHLRSLASHTATSLNQQYIHLDSQTVDGQKIQHQECKPLLMPKALNTYCLDTCASVLLDQGKSGV